MKLAVNQSTQEAVAVKILSLDKAQGAAENVRKEVNKKNSFCKPWSVVIVAFEKDSTSF